ncbi:unnamed protein product, partial [Iphiclides podalirius]
MQREQETDNKNQRKKLSPRLDFIRCEIESRLAYRSACAARAGRGGCGAWRLHLRGSKRLAISQHTKLSPRLDFIRCEIESRLAYRSACAARAGRGGCGAWRLHLRGSKRLAISQHTKLSPRLDFLRCEIESRLAYRSACAARAGRGGCGAWRLHLRGSKRLAISQHTKLSPRLDFIRCEIESRLAYRSACAARAGRGGCGAWRLHLRGSKRLAISQHTKLSPRLDFIRCEIESRLAYRSACAALAGRGGCGAWRLHLRGSKRLAISQHTKLSPRLDFIRCEIESRLAYRSACAARAGRGGCGAWRLHLRGSKRLAISQHTKLSPRLDFIRCEIESRLAYRSACAARAGRVETRVPICVRGTSRAGGWVRCVAATFTREQETSNKSTYEALPAIGLYPLRNRMGWVRCVAATFTREQETSNKSTYEALPAIGLYPLRNRVETRVPICVRGTSRAGGCGAWRLHLRGSKRLAISQHTKLSPRLDFIRCEIESRLAYRSACAARAGRGGCGAWRLHLRGSKRLAISQHTKLSPRLDFYPLRNRVETRVPICVRGTSRAGWVRCVAATFTREQETSNKSTYEALPAIGLYPLRNRVETRVPICVRGTSRAGWVRCVAATFTREQETSNKSTYEALPAIGLYPLRNRVETRVPICVRGTSRAGWGCALPAIGLYPLRNRVETRVPICVRGTSRAGWVRCVALHLRGSKRLAISQHTKLSPRLDFIRCEIESRLAYRSACAARAGRGGCGAWRLHLRGSKRLAISQHTKLSPRLDFIRCEIESRLAYRSACAARAGRGGVRCVAATFTREQETSNKSTYEALPAIGLYPLRNRVETRVPICVRGTSRAGWVRCVAATFTREQETSNKSTYEALPAIGLYPLRNRVETRVPICVRGTSRAGWVRCVAATFTREQETRSTYEHLSAGAEYRLARHSSQHTISQHLPAIGLYPLRNRVETRVPICVRGTSRAGRGVETRVPICVRGTSRAGWVRCVAATFTREQETSNKSTYEALPAIGLYPLRNRVETRVPICVRGTSRAGWVRCVAATFTREQETSNKSTYEALPAIGLYPLRNRVETRVPICVRGTSRAGWVRCVAATFTREQETSNKSTYEALPAIGLYPLRNRVETRVPICVRGTSRAGWVRRDSRTDLRARHEQGGVGAVRGGYIYAGARD